MRSVWKFPVGFDEFSIEMPKGAKLLAVDTQKQLLQGRDRFGNAVMESSIRAESRGVPMLWALVDPEAPKVQRRFLLVGTGQPLPDEVEGFTFVDSFQLQNGALVFHLFDVGERFE